MRRGWLPSVPTPTPTSIEEMKRLYATVDPKTGCWIWRGRKTGIGYGSAFFNGKTVSAHRLAYELAKGPIPAGLPLDHLCRQRACFNPAHLEAVTQRENVLRGEGVAAKHARKTHCKNGHPLSGDNLIIINTERGWRECRQCRRDRHARAHLKGKAR